VITEALQQELRMPSKKKPPNQQRNIKLKFSSWRMLSR